MLADGLDSLKSLNDLRVGEVGEVEEAEEAAGGILGDLDTGRFWREGRAMERNGGPCILGADL